MKNKLYGIIEETNGSLRIIEHFSSKEEAQKTVSEYNGKILSQSSYYVSEITYMYDFDMKMPSVPKFLNKNLIGNV